MFTRNPTLDEIARAAVGVIKPAIAGRQMAVQFEGETAAVAWDNSTVTLYLPGWDYDSRLPRAVADAWIGYYVHEVGHVLHTDKTAWETAINEGIQSLVNGLEDARMERVVIRSGKFPNARACLSDITENVIAEALAEPQFDPADLHQLAFVLAIAGRARLSGMCNDTAADWLAKLPASVRPDVDQALTDLETAKTTADVLQIARRLAKNPAVQAKLNEMPDEQEQGQGKNGGKGQGAGGNGAGSGIRDPNAKPQPVPGGAKGKRTGKRHSTHDGTIRGWIAAYDGHVETRVDTSRGGRTDLSQVLSKTGRLRQKITNAIRCPETVDHEHRQARGKLTARGYADAMTDAPNVWTRRTYTPGVDTSMLIVLDGSGSMGGTKHFAQMRLAYAFATAGESAGAKVAIAAFEDGGSHLCRNRIVQSIRGARLAILKDFKSRLAAAMPVLQAYQPGSGTPLSGAILAGTQWLYQSTPHATRRIMLLLTDGESNDTGGRFAVSAAIELVKTRLAGQVEMAAIGVETKVDYMPCPNAYVMDCNTLAVEGLDLLAKTLAKQGDALARAAA